ncbi:hypothetical protein BJ165DRAFT_1527262 [Panaeolus papilionaceus]|nr:hypothetical protein BJ165DRAFT_1527262 [Panaeolus papilionaceus]
MKSVAMKQPPEVLQNIMEELIGLDVILPYTRRPLLHVTGHPRAKILPLVYLCKSWYLGIVPQLYRDILITSLSQISGLSETLQKVECSGLRACVESIEIQNLYPDEIASSTFQDEIQMLLRICPNLTKFAYTHTDRNGDIFYSPFTHGSPLPSHTSIYNMSRPVRSSL